ncbi:MAG: hypothetical protein FJY67_10825 [Calditrichaeota bacterium]|nr:hypothetical protein [Calditrichota bacterium]
MHGIIEEIGIAIVAATSLGYLFHLLKQPVILGYFVAGALIGPEMGLKLVAEPESIEVISEIGLILLLFIIGLELKLQEILASGKALITAGIGQFFLSILIGLGFFQLIGFHFGDGRLDALYLAIFTGLSSTAIVVKLLYDKFELDTRPGRITLGILIFQDIWAILVLAFQPNLNDPKLIYIGLALLKGTGLLLMGWALSKYFLKWTFEKIAKTPELVVAVSVAWCAFVTGVAGFIGLSMEMGALIAGAAISSFPYSVHVTAKILPLRDFFMTLFFLSLGMKIPYPELEMMTTVLLIVLFTVISRFITVYPLLSLTGSGRRTSFIASINLAQISEFSLVIAAIGVSYKHIDEKLLSTIIYAMAITSIGASYFIKGNHFLYILFNNFVTRLGFKQVADGATEDESGHAYSIFLLGYHRGASALVSELELNHPEILKKLMVIDFSLETLNTLQSRGIHCAFGDISSIDSLEHLHIHSAEIIISTIPDMLLKGTNNLSIVRGVRAIAPNATIIATADSQHQMDELKQNGATEVIIPYSMIGKRLAEIVVRDMEYVSGADESASKEAS